MRDRGNEERAFFLRSVSQAFSPALKRCHIKQFFRGPKGPLFHRSHVSPIHAKTGPRIGPDQGGEEP
jgi:hypothetical protein